MWEGIFQFLFKYPPVAFERGRMTLASSWPSWVLILLVLAGAALVAVYLLRQKPRLGTPAKAFVWASQSLTLAILLLLLWRPALVLSTLLPQQNVLAVLVDDSLSMAMADEGPPRFEQVKEALGDSSSLMGDLRDKFQVRQYSFSNMARRLNSVEDLTARGTSSRVEEALTQVYTELRHLPLAGMVVVTDGAQNVGTSSTAVLQEMEARKIPIYSLGVGREQLERDVQIDELSLPRTALPGSLVSANATLRQRGYIGQSARLEVREGNRLLKSREVQFGPSEVVIVPISFTPQTQGIREYTVTVVPARADAIRENNTRSRLMEVQERQAKVLYLEGEPRWEYKFIRQALDQDASVHVVSLLRTSANKFYRQGIEDESELAEGVPSAEQLFQYQGLIIGSLGASFFSPEQQRDIYEFVSRRGGGVLFLGGREALGTGGYQASTLADLLPVDLQSRNGPATLQRDRAKFQLTARGWERLQLADDDAANRTNWENLPALGTYQITGEPKPGAVVLGEAILPGGQRQHMLVSQRFGRGRGFLFATDGSWRWRMELEAANRSHETFWRQLMHALVSETPPFVGITSEKALYADETRVRLVAQVYDENFEPINAANAIATVHSPDGESHELRLQHSTEEDGVFWGEWEAGPSGVYRVDLAADLAGEPVGSATSYFQRADGVLEYFSPEQNVALLRRLAEQTGGRYYPLAEASSLPEHLTYSPAGVSVPEVRDLWDMPFWLFLLLGLKGGEWVLRKRMKTV